MEETGIVVAVEGDVAKVRLVRRSTCDKCGVCGMGQHPEIVVEVPDTAGAKPGDEVRLAIEDRRVLRAAAVVYGLPVLALLAGYLLVDTLLRAAGFEEPRETPAIGGAVLGLVLAFAWIKGYDRRAGGRFTPRMIEVTPRPVSRVEREPEC